MLSYFPDLSRSKAAAARHNPFNQVSFSNFEKNIFLICGIVAWQFLTQKADPFSPSCRSHKAINRGARDSVGFSVASWTMPDATSGLVRLGRLMVGPVIGRVATF